MKVLQHLAATVASMGIEIPDAALEIMVRDLAGFPEADVIIALARCRQELRRMSLVDILERIPGGHPGPEEAWSICAPALGNEHASVVWTDEIAQAFWAASNLHDDPVAARMAFKEIYGTAAGRARAERRPPIWIPSLGWEKSGRELAVLDAVEKGRLTAEHAQAILPYHREDEGLNGRLLALAARTASKLALAPSTRHSPNTE